VWSGWLVRDGIAIAFSSANKPHLVEEGHVPVLDDGVPQFASMISAYGGPCLVICTGAAIVDRPQTLAPRAFAHFPSGGKNDSLGPVYDRPRVVLRVRLIATQQQRNSGATATPRQQNSRACSSALFETND
jgi:hypothetical protein